MSIDNRKEPEPSIRPDSVRHSVEQFITAGVADPGGVLGNLDRWSQRRVAAENMGKVELMLEA